MGRGRRPGGPEVAAGLPWFVGQAAIEVTERSRTRSPLCSRASTTPRASCWPGCWRARPWAAPATRHPDTPPTDRSRDCWKPGCCVRIDDETVILPRVVGQVMRSEAPGPLELTAPALQTTSTTPADVDAVAAGAAIDLLREIDLIIETLGSTPVPELRNGGLGVRDVKRLAKATGIEEPRLGTPAGIGRGCRADRRRNARTRPA